jgi:UDP-N-acetylmuramoyl-L-alanyl-D-glutamate--2,6-diaminopimelate ligase
MRLDDLLRTLQPLEHRGPADLEVKGVAAHSRQVQRGYVFVAVRGTRDHGLDHLAEALQRGAAVVVSEDPATLPRGVAHLRVADARLALARIATAFFGQPAHYLSVAGITGTNGKTTVAHLLRDILRAHGARPGMIGTVCHEMGDRVIPSDRTTPDAPELQAMLAQMRHADCHAAVMEVSSHALDQRRVEGIDFDVAVFTNLTRDHLDYHPDLEAYFEAKARLFSGLGRGDKDARAVINVDDPWGLRLLDRVPAGVPLFTYGLAATAMVRAEEIELRPEGTRFRLCTPWGDTPLATPLLGRFNVLNLLAAAAAAGSLGVPLATLARVLAAAPGAPGRLERVPAPGHHVFVDYAHTPDALENVLATLREITPGRLICVFGCGGDRDRGKRPAMGAAAARGADFSILTSDNPRTEDPLAILRDIAEGLPPDTPHLVQPDRALAIAEGLDRLQPGDVLLIAGKGHERFQEVGRTRLEFDDREVAARLIARRGRA